MRKTKLLILIVIGIILSLYLIQETQCATTVLKAMVVNPSRTKTQKALLKAYLPKEVKPNDVLDAADLKIDYDVEKGLYYIHQEFTLKPGENIVREVEIRDVWIIPDEELSLLSEQARKVMEELRGSEYFQTAVEFIKDIDDKQKNIIRTQSEAADALPQTHIAVYRANVERLQEIKAKVAKLEEMLLKLKLASGAGGPKRVSVRTSWLIILGVIIALGLLSFIFFIIWHKQSGALKDTDDIEDQQKDILEEK